MYLFLHPRCYYVRVRKPVPDCELLYPHFSDTQWRKLERLLETKYERFAIKPGYENLVKLAEKVVVGEN